MEEKKERILSIAQKIFARFGINKTTMDEIAKMARMGKATLYYYFKSKEDIFAEVIHKESNILKQKLSEAINKVKTPKEKITAYVLTRMKHLKELVNYYSALTDDYLDHYSFVEKERQNFTHYEMDTLKNILFAGNNEGVFQVKDVDVTARMLTIALKGLEYPLIIEDKAVDIETEINLMLDILFKGMEKR
ncbi:MAG TPA: TetR/AcrR family transcriptional regulator [bacterium]|nr:TetR/AcrR family transcriptional regulator [bacterium]